MRKFVLYARVSTADQHSGLEAQIRSLKEHCEKNNITDFELYTDENISGAKVSRPSLDRMMESVRRGEVSAVCCYSFSRFARSTTHLLSALEEMKKYNTDFISITERVETSSPIGKAFFTIIAAIGAELAEWRLELSRKNRTIADEIAAHADEKFSKNLPSQFATSADDTGPGITLSPDDPTVELELVR